MKKNILIAIGSELLNGNTVDQNTSILGLELSLFDQNLDQTIIIADIEELILETLKLYCHSNNNIFICGGLGPTPDDMTKKTIAKFCHKKVIFSNEAKELTHFNYQRVNKEVPKNCGYYNIPEHFQLIKNPVGLAHGLKYEQDLFSLFLLPGVPQEFLGMMREEILPSLFQKKPKNLNEYMSVRTFGLPEEKIFSTLCPTLWNDLSQYGSVASLPRKLGVDINIKLKSIDCRQDVLNIFNSSKLKDNIYSFNNESIEEVIANICKKNDLTLSTVESCTGGLISHKLTNVSGASSFFKGSIISYFESLKVNLLQVSQNTIDTKNIVSEEVALEMIKGLPKASLTDISISTTGLAGPTGGSDLIPVGTVCVAVKVNNNYYSKTFKFKPLLINEKTRGLLKEKFSLAALYFCFENLSENLV